jgi:hypothetical protein
MDVFGIFSAVWLWVRTEVFGQLATVRSWFVYNICVATVTLYRISPLLYSEIPKQVIFKLYLARVKIVSASAPEVPSMQVFEHADSTPVSHLSANCVQIPPINPKHYSVRRHQIRRWPMKSFVANRRREGCQPRFHDYPPKIMYVNTQ